MNGSNGSGVTPTAVATLEVWKKCQTNHLMLTINHGDVPAADASPVG